MNFAAVRFNKIGLLFLVGATILIIYYAFNGKHREVGEVVVEDVSFVQQQQLGNGKVSLKALLAASINISQRGGLEVVAVRKSSGNLQEIVKGKTKEGVKDSATEGDYRSHKVMYYGLRKAFPEVKVISEEHTDTPDLGEVLPASTIPTQDITLNMPGDEMINAEDIVFWIDPLDATKEYTENLVDYVMTMVGVAVKGKPIIGVLHRPFQGDTYWAVVGHGNSENLNKVHDKQDKPLGDNKEVRIIVSRSHAGNVKNFTKHVLGPNDHAQIISAAGAGYKVLEVIENRADVYAHVTAIKKWDLCAGYAILNALGGTMTTLNGEFIDFSGHTDPLNTKGILAYMMSNHVIEQLKTIRIKE